LKQAARAGLLESLKCAARMSNTWRLGGQYRMSQNKVPAFFPLTGIYEPSAVEQLPDGRFLVVEDENEHALNLVTINAAGHADDTPLSAGLLQMFSAFWTLDDLEGLALDRSGYVYAITSHSRDDDGDEKKSRAKLARFRIEGNHVIEPLVVDGLKRVMTDTHPVLATAAKIRNVKTNGGLNIEALEISPDQQRLLIGFRSPLQDGQAIIASVNNLAGIFDAHETPRMSDRLDLLNLDGNGIRAMCHVPALGGYLVVGGQVSGAKSAFGLWFWSGAPGATARRVTVDGLPDFKRAEGICCAVIDGAQRIVVVSDDGDREAKRPAHFLLLDPTQLVIEP